MAPDIMTSSVRPPLELHLTLPGGSPIVQRVQAQFHSEGETAAAQEVEAVADARDRSIGWLALATLCLNARLFEATMTFARRIGPELAPVRHHVLKAAAAYELGRVEDAIRASHAAIKADGRNTNALKIYISANLMKGDVEAARSALGLLMKSAQVDLKCIDLAENVHTVIGAAFPRRAFQKQVAFSLVNAGRLIDALPLLQQLEAAGGADAEVWKGLAAAYFGAGEMEAAEEAARKALPDPEAWNLLGLILTATCRAAEAPAAYQEAAKSDRHAVMALANAAMAMHYSPNYSKGDIAGAISQYANAIKAETAGRPVAAPKRRDGMGRPLRIGVLSGHFHSHPAMALSLAAWERLDPAEIELFAYANGGKRDAVTRRFQQCCTTWREIGGVQDDALIALMLEDRLDALVDLSGHALGRVKAILSRPAPTIIKWVGGLYNTTGLKAYDWLIGDAIQIPEGEEAGFFEQVYRMPGNYVVFDPPAAAPDVAPLPARNAGAVSFGCFNNAAKVNEALVSSWARILKATPNSRLLLKCSGYSSPTAREQVIGWFRSRGIESGRLEFKGQSSQRDHLAAYGEVDIALDTWPYTGGLTTCEALWMGCPVVTRTGWTFAGRHAATHLTSIGRTEWIATSQEAYVDTAVGLASDLDVLETLRAGLREHVRQSRLCDAERFARELTRAFQTMVGASSGD
jgi:predicted O-linked N-acetylglucosamine transferase (SPINDLY family)